MAESSASAAELKSLLSYLNNQRQHVLGIAEGLDEAALRRPVLPSQWTALGMLSHLARDDERFWLRGVVAGEQSVKDEVAAGADGWKVDPAASAEEIIGLYRDEIERSNAILAEVDLVAEPGWWPTELFGQWKLGTVREVVLHLMNETATHAGHLDAARELLDGRQWLVLTE